MIVKATARALQTRQLLSQNKFGGGSGAADSETKVSIKTGGGVTESSLEANSPCHKHACSVTLSDPEGNVWGGKATTDAKGRERAGETPGDRPRPKARKTTGRKTAAGPCALPPKDGGASNSAAFPPTGGRTTGRRPARPRGVEVGL